MGLRQRDSRVALLVEIAVPLLTATVVGALVAWIAARTVFATLDPKPALPPPALFRPAVEAMLLTLGLVLVGSGILAVVLDRTSRRADQAEVIRGGG